MKSIRTATIVIAVGLILLGSWALLTQIVQMIHGDFTSVDLSFLLIPVGIGLLMKRPQSLEWAQFIVFLYGLAGSIGAVTCIYTLVTKPFSLFGSARLVGTLALLSALAVVSFWLLKRSMKKDVDGYFFGHNDSSGVASQKRRSSSLRCRLMKPE